MYPLIRLRRNRRTEWIRNLLAEANLTVNDLILPVFVIEGHAVRQEITTMPGVYRLSQDELVKDAKEAAELGIKAIALFPCIDPQLKNDNADEAYNPDNLICRAVRSLRTAEVDIGIICDVALDPYTSGGHDGLVSDSGEIDNDRTVEALSDQALVLAKAGVDIVAPSDMMDGRIQAIRRTLDENDFHKVSILAYSAKYNSAFYGPFRDAVKSNRTTYLCKASYQMDVRNASEAMREIEYDISEGADMVMIKPGMPYLDVIHAAKQNFKVPVLAYQVSGEYAMLKFASMNGALNWEQSLIESLIAFKRAGAAAVFTYAALDAARILKNMTP